MSVLPAAIAPMDIASHEWLRTLRADGATRDEAVSRLHALLLRAAHFEAARRLERFPHLRDELEEIAHEAAADALISVLARLDDFRGESRFTTWVYKFALLETAVKLRKRAWQGREVPLEPEGWGLLPSAGLEPDPSRRRIDSTSLPDSCRSATQFNRRRVEMALSPAANGPATR